MPFTSRLPCYADDDGCIDRADIYYPSNRGPWPVVVTVHGRPRTPADMAPLARRLARRGAVVFNIDYRGVRPVTKGFPESISDVACAVRWARRTARGYGGDPRHLVLVGHSQGGYVGAMVSLAGDTFPGRRGSCLARRGDSLPEGFVSVAGVSAIHPGMLLDQIYFGGTVEQIPDVWRRGTIYTHMGGNARLKVGIVFEMNDPILGVGHAIHLVRAFKAHGYRTKMVLLEEGWTHFDILNVESEIGRRVVLVVERIIRWSRPRPHRAPTGTSP